MNYKAVLTDTGRNIINAAYAAGETVTISKIELGDGGGIDVEVDSNATHLVNSFGEQAIQKGRATNAAISVLTRVSDEFDGHIVREFGLRDEDGNLIIYANHPASEIVAGQPLPLEIGCDMYIENAAVVRVAVTNVIGGSFPVNATLALNVNDELYFDENGAQWLRSGVTLSNVDDYPLATVTEIPEKEILFSNSIDTSTLPEGMQDVTETAEHYVASTSNGYFVILSKEDGALIEVTPQITGPHITQDIAYSEIDNNIYYVTDLDDGNIGRATEADIRAGTTTGETALTLPNGDTTWHMTINGSNVIYVDRLSKAICLTDTTGSVSKVLIDSSSYTGNDIASFGDMLYTTSQGGGNVYFLSAYSLSALLDGTSSEPLWRKDIGEIISHATSVGLVATAENEFFAVIKNATAIRSVTIRNDDAFEAVKFKVNDAQNYIGLPDASIDSVTGLPIYIRIA